MKRARRPPRLFGSERRTQVLILLALLGTSYPAELVRLLDATKSTMLQILEALELEGVIASRQLGRTRQVSLDPRFFGARELDALLAKLAAGSPELQRIAASRRARPRRKGKPL